MYEMEATMTMNAGAFAPTIESFARIVRVCVWVLLFLSFCVRVCMNYLPNEATFCRLKTLFIANCYIFHAFNRQNVRCEIWRQQRDYRDVIGYSNWNERNIYAHMKYATVTATVATY